MNNSGYFTLEELENDRRENRSPLDFLGPLKIDNPELITQMEENLNLLFTDEKTEEGAVCYALSPEVRDDFKVHFSTPDLRDYCWAAGHLPENRNHPSQFNKNKLPLPVSTDRFWNWVHLGKRIRLFYQFKLFAFKENHPEDTPDSEWILNLLKDPDLKETLREIQ